MSALERFKELSDQAALVGSAASTLGWDQETYLPAKSNAWRARQLAWLSGRRHELTTSQAWGEALEAALESAVSPRDRASLEESKRVFHRSTCLPTSLVEREAEVTSLAKQAWAAARRDSSFSDFAPHLRKVLELSREKAELWGYANEPYDALIETYERGATATSIERIFTKAEPELVDIARQAEQRSREIDARLPDGPYPIDQQMGFNRMVAESFGFDFDAGRIDTTTHPFCTILGPADVRLTTRYDESDFTSSFFGVLHETGHGLYEQGLLQEDFGTPAGSAVSLGVHESQSRLWENHVGRSRCFWERWLPVAAEHFPQLGAVELDEFLAIIHRVKFSYIRVEADEATYDLHILLRFRIERALLSGEIDVSDVPDAWNEAFKAAFGLTPPDDTRGCLQDIHWSMGGLGYFPTYTLGNFNAAQLHAAAMRDEAIASASKRADYTPLLQWLNQHVHQPGSTLAPNDILTQATGKPPGTEDHLEHLRASYLGVI